MLLPVLQTKLYIPPPRLNLVARPAITAKLRAGLVHPLTLIAAPAGFGKTTLVSEWIAQIEHPVAWLSLDDDDNDPTRFLTYLIAALQTQQPQLGSGAQELLGASQAPPPKTILTLLLNELATLTTPLVLVLDDYHLMTTPAIHEALVFLVDRLPPSFHLLITSRMDPPLPLARWRARNQLTELRVNDLRFRLAEITTFFNEMMGLPLTTEQIATLETRTEGWIAGLQLAALSMQGREDVAGFIQAFSGSHRHVLSYLVEEVLNQRPEGTLEFLLQTSILERLSAPLCDVVTGDTESYTLLQRLEQANLFLIPLDDEGTWYRYHHLFAEVLRSRLQQAHPQAIAPLHRRASGWYEQQELWSEAIHHALTAADFALAAHLIEQVGIERFAQPAIQHALKRWLASLPEALIRERPKLQLIYTWILYISSDFSAARQKLVEIEATLQHTPTAVEDSPIQGEIAAMRAILADSAPDPNSGEAITWGQQALATLTADQPTFRNIAAAAMAMAYIKQGDVVGAEQALTEAQHMAQAAGNVYLFVTAAANHAIMQRALGTLRLAQTTCREALTWVTQHNAHAYPVVGGLYLNLADLLREQNDLETAQRYAETALARTDQEISPLAMSVLSRLVLLRIKQAQREWAQVWRLLDEVAALAAQHPTLIHRSLLPALTAQLQLAAAATNTVDSVPSAALAWAQRTAWEEGELRSARRFLDFIYRYEHSRIARIQIFIASARATNDQPRLQETLSYLERQQQLAESRGLLWYQIKIHLLKALSHHALGAAAAAHTALRHALCLAQPEGYLRVFLDEGEPLRLLIVDFGFWISQQPPTEQNAQLAIYMNKLLANFGNAQSTEDKSLLDEQLSSQTPNAKVQNLVEPLSDRELEVLQQMAAGLSNTEIADHLVISVSTVKTHVNRIFGKLSVQSRTQALVRARTLGLLRD